MKYKVGICDDEIQSCELLEKGIKEMFQVLNLRVEIEVFYSDKSFIQYLVKGGNFDFVILNIGVTKMNGIHVGKFIREEQRDLRTQIVFVSSEPIYMMKLFEVQPLAFWIKPVKKEDLKKTIQKGISYLGNVGETFGFNVGAELKNVHCEDILYFRSDARKVEIHTVREKIQFYGKLSDVLNKLPNSFEQVHKSYIVNLNRIQECHYDNLKLNDGSEIPISRPYRNNVRNRILKKYNK